jgi:hypothetical protein
MANIYASKPSVPIFLNEAAIDQSLADMESNSALKTDPIATKSPEGETYMVPFHEKHAAYLRGHPKVNPEHYLANLHTMIKIRV